MFSFRSPQLWVAVRSQMKLMILGPLMVFSCKGAKQNDQGLDNYRFHSLAVGHWQTDCQANSAGSSRRFLDITEPLNARIRDIQYKSSDCSFDTDSPSGDSILDKTYRIRELQHNSAGGFSIEMRSSDDPNRSEVKYFFFSSPDDLTSEIGTMTRSKSVDGSSAK